MMISMVATPKRNFQPAEAARMSSDLPALLTPTERLTLELIRDTGVASRDRLAWAKENGYAEAVGPARHKLTAAGLKALTDNASDLTQAAAPTGLSSNDPEALRKLLARRRRSLSREARLSAFRKQALIARHRKAFGFCTPTKLRPCFATSRSGGVTLRPVKSRCATASLPVFPRACPHAPSILPPLMITPIDEHLARPTIGIAADSGPPETSTWQRVPGSTPRTPDPGNRNLAPMDRPRFHRCF
jgi:hypothetical protein